MQTSTKTVHVHDLSQDDLRALYSEHGFAALLPNCERIDIIPRRRRRPEDTAHSELTEYEEGAKFRDPATKHTVAVIFWYTDIEGSTSEIIRSLRVGDTVYNALTRQQGV
jgi:hypothetical protein